MLSTNNTNGHYEQLLLPSGEFAYNYEENRSFKLVLIKSCNKKWKQRTFFRF